MIDLLAALWRGSTHLPGNVTIFLLPSGNSLHLPVSKVPDLTAEDHRELLEDIAPVQNVYTSPGLRREGLGTKQQGGKKDIIAYAGICVDLDFYRPGAHKSERLPCDLDEAAPIIDSLPDPSAIVGTGNGAQSWWFFERPLLLDTLSRQTQLQKALKARYEQLKQRANELGYDQDLTFSTQHVFRLPGFLNHKTDPPNPTELWHLEADWRYEPSELGIQIPSWFVEPTPAKESTTTIPDPERLSEKPFTPHASEIVSELRRISPNNRYYEAIQSILKGQSFANPGDRDVALQGVCATMAWLPAGRKADPKELAEVLRPSLALWAAEEGADKTLDEELEKAVDKIRRSQEDYWDQQERSRPQLEGIARALGVSLANEPSEAEGGRPNDFFLQHAIIQFKGVFFIYDFTLDQYRSTRPYAGNEVVPKCRDAWKDAPPGISISYVNDKGQTKTKTLPRLMEEYGTVADRAIADMTIDESQYDPDPDAGLYKEAIARLIIREPEYNEDIDKWLQLLAGDSYEDLCKWIAGVPHLGEQHPALYLEGYSGTGKGLLASGLARLWNESGTPVDFETVLGGFNAPIIKCPLVWIDEGISTGRNITAEFRSLVGRSSLSINEKNEPVRPVNGAIRFMICANNQDVFMFGNSHMTARDLEAVVERLLHIEARKEAADFLVNIDTDSWVKGGAIARHCLWLYENTEFDHKGRFLMEGKQTSMHRRMALQGNSNGLIYEWLVRFATDPKNVLKTYRTKNALPLAQIRDGSILVNNQGIVDCWDLYMNKDTKRPSTTQINDVIKRLAEPKKPRLGPRGARSYFYAIKPELVLEWCRENQIGNEDKILENLGIELDEKMDEN